MKLPLASGNFAAQTCFAKQTFMENLNKPRLPLDPQGPRNFQKWRPWVGGKSGNSVFCISSAHRGIFFHLIGPPPTPVSMLFERLLDFFPRRHRVCQSPTLIRRGGGSNASESEGRGSNASYSRFSLPGMDSLWGINNSQFFLQVRT